MPCSCETVSMSAVTETQADAIRTRIADIESDVFTVEEVTLEQDDDPQGDATRVTLELTAKQVTEDERQDAFVILGRTARRIAFDVLGDDRILRVAYRLTAERDAGDSGVDDSAPAQADKNT